VKEDVVMSEAVFQITKSLRLTFAAALIVAIVLIVFGQAPAFPVIAGAVLAVGVVAIQSWSKSKR
jgi:hypothetical protein